MIDAQHRQKARELVDTFEKALGPHTGIVAAEICVKELIEFSSTYFGAAEQYWENVLGAIEKM